MTSIATPPSNNHLANEKSPYLLQHVHNPVDWYPWGEEAFAKARAENKPILVSIGYSTCHWCHVMERESYEDPAIGALMNKYLVNIKVDREERPDVDKIYMSAVSAMTGSGGWPLNVFLTPELKPFYGGTYFPPAAKWGQPAWRDVVQQIGESWQRLPERQKMIEAGDHIITSLHEYLTVISTPLAGEAAWLDHGFEALKAGYDSTHGGFSAAPKFPMPVYMNFLLQYSARTHTKEALDMTLQTLRQMANGGIYDQLGGGFARYSTDEHWHLPHFEKMLYDNAQLAVNYLEAFQISGDTSLASVARETLDYVRRDMTHPEGGFFSAEDADSLPAADAKEKREGAFYVWERDEVIGIAGDKAGDVFCFRYGVREKGNVASDPHGEFPNKNILYVAHSLPETAREFKLTVEETELLLAGAKKQLLAARSRLPRPHRDDKVLSGWNGLMISAYAKGFQILGDPRDLAAAERAARFLKSRLYEAATHQLYRRWRDGERRIPGTADDYAFVVQGLLDLYEADFDSQWLAWALELTESQNRQFYDAAQGGFFMTALTDDKYLVLRVKEDQDNVEPCASSVATLNLLRLAQITDRADFQAAAEKTLRFFGARLQASPKALPQMLNALDWSLTAPLQIVVAGKAESSDTQGLLAVIRRHYMPVKILLMADGGKGQAFLAQRLDFISAMRPIDGKAAAYVCLQHVCKEPTTDPAALERLLVRYIAEQK